MATKKKAPPRLPSTRTKSSKKKAGKKAPKKKAPAKKKAPKKKAPKKKAPKKKAPAKRVNKPRRGRQPALVLSSGTLDSARVRSMLAKADRLTVELRGSATAWVPGKDDDATAPGIVVYTRDKDSGDVVASKRAKQGARMLKVHCPKCGYNVRTTRRWLEQAIPSCPLGHGTMDAPDVETEDAE